MRIGIDVGGTKIEIVVLAANGEQVYQKRIPTPRDDYRATLRAITGLVRAAESDLGQDCSVGIGIPGAISPATGLVKNANSTWLIGQPMESDLAEMLARPVRLANDANCFALSEATDGAGAGAETVFGVILGSGVGGGIIHGGVAIVGQNAIAGEWGHLPLPWPRDDERPGPPCYCGLQGCIETFLSGPALARSYFASTGVEIEPAEIASRASLGDEQAEQTLQTYENRLARALALVINLFDPAVIVLGGGISNLERLYQNVPGRWPEYVFSHSTATQLRKPKYGDSSGVRGAAWLWHIDGEAKKS